VLCIPHGKERMKFLREKIKNIKTKKNNNAANHIERFNIPTVFLT
jgi:hypothetical protein